MNRPNANAAFHLAPLVVLAAWLASGCSSMPWHKVSLDAASGFYADASLAYRLDAGQLGQPLDVVRVEGQRVSYEQVASSPLAGQSIGTLTITFPHPAGRAGYALARFTLDSANPGSGAKVASTVNLFGKRKTGLEAPTTISGAQPEVHETWELDVVRAESDHLFEMLTHLGYYNSDHPGAVAHLTVKMNGKEQSKDWDQVPALNALIQRVRTQGRLVAYARPGAAPGAAQASIASTAAYRDLLAARGMAAASPAANPFSLLPAPQGSAPPIGPAVPAAAPAAGLAQRPAGGRR